MKSLLIKATEDKVRKEFEDSGELASFDRSKLHSALNQIHIKTTDVRTTRKDPDSSRKFCAAKVSVGLPAAIKQIIDSARSAAGLDDWNQSANRAGLEHDASAASTDVEFSVQPTDDNKRLIAESDSAGTFVNFFADIFGSYLRSDQLRAAKIAEDRAEAERNAEQMAVNNAVTTAQQELATADLAEAQADFKLSNQKINAVWRAIPASTRKSLAPTQIAWNHRREAQCTVEAAGQTTDPTALKTAKLRCESKAMNEKSSQLESYAVYSNSGSAEAARSDADGE